MAEYPDAIEYYVDESRVFIDQNSHSAITIHGTGGNAAQTVQQLGDYFRTNGEMVSSHFGIDRAGNVAQFVRLQDGAAANCCIMPGHDTFWDQFNGENLNWHTISIEHENDLTNSLPLTDAQKQASFKLIAWLCDKFDIDADHIKSHASIDPINRAHCPGPAYPWNELFDYLNQSGGGDTTVLTIDQASQYFIETAPGQRWHCKQTNQDIAFGILTYYRTCSGTRLNGLSQFGLPVSPENSVPGHPGVTFQIMERGVIVYDPKHEVDSVPGITGPCYPGHLDKFLPQSPQNAPQTPVVTINTQAAISTIQAVTTALQSAVPALQSAAKDLEPS